jgi:uroporphyrinogen decarboxylase
MAAWSAMSNRRDLPNSPYLAAAGGRKPHRVPVWFMRQAGRSLPEYRALRAKNTMMQACFDAELITEITLQPVRRHAVDAAILFSDIVVPLRASGIDLDIVPDVGPVIAHPIRTAADVAAMRPLEREKVSPVADAVSLLVAALDDVPLIGFAGAPFTLASYLVEGGPSRNHERTKAMMLGEPGTWHALMSALTDVTIGFLRAQLDAGVDAIQLFDSWAGTLSLADYPSTCSRTAPGCSTRWPGTAGRSAATRGLCRAGRSAATRGLCRAGRSAATRALCRAGRSAATRGPCRACR